MLLMRLKRFLYNHASWIKLLMLIFVMSLSIHVIIMINKDLRMHKIKQEGMERLKEKMSIMLREKDVGFVGGYVAPVRTNIVFLHFLTVCHVCQLAKEIPNSFTVNVTQKLVTKSKGLSLNYMKRNEVGISSAANLLRTIFLCGEGERSSLLLDETERKSCTESAVRIGIVRFVAVSDLLPLIQELSKSVKLYLVTGDPRHELSPLTARDKKQKIKYFQVLCHKMATDLDTIEEQALFYPLAYAVITQEIFLARPFYFWKMINRGAGQKIDNFEDKKWISEKEDIDLIKQYKWFLNNKSNPLEYQMVDNQCYHFYARSIYRSINADSTSLTRYKGVRLPLKTANVH